MNISFFFLIILGLLILSVPISIIVLVVYFASRTKRTYPASGPAERRHIAREVRQRAERSRRSSGGVWIVLGVGLLVALPLALFLMFFVSYQRVSREVPGTRSIQGSSTDSHDSGTPQLPSIRETRSSSPRTPGKTEEITVHTFEHRDPPGTESVELPASTTITQNKDRAVFHLASPRREWERLELFLRDATGQEPSPSSLPAWLHEHEERPLIFENPVASIRSTLPDPGGDWIGTSPDWDPDPDAAYLAAESSGTHQLAALYLWELAREVERDPGLQPQEFLNLEPIQICLSMAGQNLPDLRVERFDQEVEKNIARYHRAAVRYRLPPDHLERVRSHLLERVQRARLETFRQERQLLWTTVTAGVLSVIVFLLYLLLNTSTRGFFTWRLRIFSLLLLGLVYFGLFQIRAWFF